MTRKTATTWIAAGSVLTTLGLASAAGAQNHYTTTQNVLVWKMGRISEAIQLKNAGVWTTNPQVVVPLVACVVTPGTQFVTLNSGGSKFYSDAVVVTSGPESGCRGEVERESLRKR